MTLQDFLQRFFKACVGLLRRRTFHDHVRRRQRNIFDIVNIEQKISSTSTIVCIISVIYVNSAYFIDLEFTYFCDFNPIIISY
jgi:hypothetical protein